MALRTAGCSQLCTLQGFMLMKNEASQVIAHIGPARAKYLQHNNVFVVQLPMRWVSPSRGDAETWRKVIAQSTLNSDGLIAELPSAGGSAGQGEFAPVGEGNVTQMLEHTFKIVLFGIYKF